MRGRGRGRGGGYYERSPPRRRRSSAGERTENYYCIFCKVQLSSLRLSDDHNKSAVHKQKEILIKKAVKDGLQFCYTCEKIFPSKIELDAHCLMSRHQPLYRNEELQNMMTKKEDEVIPSSSSSEHDTRRAKDDMARRDIVLKLNKLRDNEEEDYDALKNDDRRKETIKKEHFCDICNVDCLNNSNYRIHVASWRHRAEIDKKHDQERKTFDKDAERHFDGDSDKDRIKVPSHLTGNVQQYSCEVCSVPLAGEQAYLVHLKGRKHLRQVNQMRRPYKCYICVMEFTVEKEFNYHLESRSHMDKAFAKDPLKGKSRNDKNDEWVEKKASKRRRSRSREKERKSGSYRENKRDRKRVEEDSKSNENRRVEIVKSPVNETGGAVTDLRVKLKGKKIMVTTQNPTSKDKSDQAPVDDRGGLDKRAKELEFETKFKKTAKEYENNLNALKEKMTKEREMDIAAYQQYENTYRRLCEEEDFIRESLRVLEEDDPRKEEYIRDMIRIQRDMREVRQELEFREMMIIKRESLFREKFPNSTDNKVLINQEVPPTESLVIDYNHGNASKQATEKPDSFVNPETTDTEANDDDLRVQLERERLMKRLGPELDSIDPSIREKLLSVIFDKDAAVKVEGKQSNDKRQVVKSAQQQQQDDNMQYLTAREKQLERELAELKTSDATKVSKSLVPQYDDLDERNKNTKKRSTRRRNLSASSDSSRSSSSSSSDSRYSKKDKKRRKSSPSKSRNKSKRSGSVSSDRSRKKRKRSTSRDRDRRRKSSNKKNDDRRKKLDKYKNDKKKLVKMTVKARQKDHKLSSAGNPLPGDSDSEKNDNEMTNTIPVIGGVTIPVIGGNSDATQQFTQQQPVPRAVNSMQGRPNVAPAVARREQFSLWKNPATPAPAAAVDSPKEDVWDVAFSGGQIKEGEAAATLNLFNSNPEIPNQLPLDILNILRNVAPIIQNNSAINIAQPAVATVRPPAVSRAQPLFPVISRSSFSTVTTAPNKDIPMWNRNAPSSTSVVWNRNLPSVSTPQSDMVTQEQVIKNPSTVGDAGGKVRSILKKMKEPAKVEPPVEEVFPPETVVIPGLESISTANDERVIDQTDQDLRKQSESRSNGITDPTSANENKDVYNESTAYSHSVERKNSSIYRPQPAHLSDSPSINFASSNNRNESRQDRSGTWATNDDAAGRRIDGDDYRTYADTERRLDYPPERTADSRLYALNNQREISPVQGMRPVRQGDPYNNRDDIRGPVVSENRSGREDVQRDLETRGRQPLQRTIERDPYIRSDERDHMTIDGRSRVPIDRLPVDLRPPPLPEALVRHPRRPVESSIPEDLSRPPTRRPGESEQGYYERFERFYEIKRRGEKEDMLRREQGLPLDRSEADHRRLPDGRAVARGDPRSGLTSDSRLLAEEDKRLEDYHFNRILDDRRVRHEERRPNNRFDEPYRRVDERADYRRVVDERGPAPYRQVEEHAPGYGYRRSDEHGVPKDYRRVEDRGQPGDYRRPLSEFTRSVDQGPAADYSGKEFQDNRSDERRLIGHQRRPQDDSRPLAEERRQIESDYRHNEAEPMVEHDPYKSLSAPNTNDSNENLDKPNSSDSKPLSITDNTNRIDRGMPTELGLGPPESRMPPERNMQSHAATSHSPSPGYRGTRPPGPPHQARSKYPQRFQSYY